MKAFIDTNVLVYCTDTSNPIKQACAKRLIAQLIENGEEIIISTQVLIELFHVLTRKQKMPPASAQALIQSYTNWMVIPSDSALVQSAIGKSIQYQFSIWDSMVLQAALNAKATTLYTEDLTHGQRFENLVVINPFRAI